MIAYTMRYILTKSVITSILTTNSILFAITPLSSFGFITQWFNRYPFEDTVEKEYTVKSMPCTITIDQTLRGTISVTGWDQQKIALKATKKVKKENDTETLAVSVSQNIKGLTIRTGYAQGHKKTYSSGAVDLELLVPAKATIVSDSIDDIHIQDMASVVEASTQQGSITAYNIQDSLRVRIGTQGTILLDNIDGDIYAKNQYGDTIVKRSHKNVVVHSECGNIIVTCATLPSNSMLDLKVKSKGSIDLKLPETTHATIEGNTETGKIICKIPVTLERYTTVLTPQTYKKMPKHMRGIIGEEGNNAAITLSSIRGISIAPAQIAA